MAKSICPIHGITNGSCDKCKKSSNRTYDKYKRDKELNKFYHSARWIKIRSLQLKKFPLCIECGQPAKIVDHIEEIRDGGDRYSLENLQSMCISCHNRKTAKAKSQRGGGVKSLESETPMTEAPPKFLQKPFSWGGV